MSRPTRIEYENAFYHVMNRGAGRQTIFPDDRYYHLLIETPRANLGRVIRHINGVYTQRYNRLKKRMARFFEVDIRRYW